MFVAVISNGISAQVPRATAIVSGEAWLDSKGNRITAHAGSVLFHEGHFYWYGERRGKTIDEQPGVRAYRSTDLMNWEDLGTVLSKTTTPGDTLEVGCIIERPKVLFNRKTGKFIMWFHFEDKGRGYGPAKYGVAIADAPQGPFTLVRAERPNKGIWPANAQPAEMIASYQRPEWLPESMRIISIDASDKRYKRLIDGFNDGQEARDQTVWQDEDGKAYHFYSSEMNGTMHIAELSEDYLSHTGKYVRALWGQSREAPCVFKRNGRYYLITSGCTGWAPNPAMLHVSDSIWGPWKDIHNPWQGEEAMTRVSFESQGAMIFSLPNYKDAFVFLSDRWRPKQISDSRYVWQILEFKDNHAIINWRDRWDLSVFTPPSASDGK
jgi:hypothetical protein